MPDSLLLAIGFVVCAAGFGWLALAMDVHWLQVRSQESPSPMMRRVLRMLGVLAILASLVLCLSVDHATMASLVWFMLLTASALSVAFLLTWRPRLLSPLVAWVPRTR